jgi:hypothetical protein
MVMLIILITIVSFLCWRAMRDSDLLMDDTFVGYIESFIFGCLKYTWVIGLIVIMVRSVS